MHSIVVTLLALFLAGMNPSFAGGDFEGIIIYTISYGDQELDPQAAAMMPKTAKFIIKDKKSLMDMSMGMGSTKIIFNGEDNTGVMLMDMMGQKFAITMSSEDLEKEIEETPDADVEITGKTKEIAGYDCQEAIVKFKEDGSSEEVELVVYFTDELGSSVHNMSNPLFMGIDGVMLEYTVKEDHMDMKFSAISVDKKRVSDSEFEVPEGFQIMDQSDFENMFGGF